MIGFTSIKFVLPYRISFQWFEYLWRYNGSCLKIPLLFTNNYLKNVRVFKVHLVEQGIVR